MPRFTLSKLKQTQPSMRRRLFLYMGALAALLLVVLFAALLLLGRFKSPREEMKKSLTFQMEAFRTDMTSLWRNVSVMGVHLSEDMTGLIEEQTTDISSLNGDITAVEALQEAMLEPLCQYVRQADCSGAFVLLNASLSTDPSSDSRMGLYVQRGNAEHATGDLLLYRGMADVGRRHKVMPHRKWAQELDLSSFPGLAEHLRKAAAPIEHSCRTTELVTLPGTTEQAILLTVPILGSDGTVYGLCGFSVNQSYFSAHHAQPTGIGSLACVLSDPADGLDIQKSLLTYPAGGFCFVPDELLAERSLRGGLAAFVGTELSFVGISEPFTVAAGDEESHALTVLIAKDTYDRSMLKSGFESIALLMLLLFFGVVCCIFYTRRCLRPVLWDLERLKDERDSGQVTFEELLPISEKLRFRKQTITELESEKQKLQGQMEQAESDARQLAQRRMDELAPEEYQLFLAAYRKLGLDQRAAIDAMADGVSVQTLSD